MASAALLPSPSVASAGQAGLALQKMGRKGDAKEWLDLCLKLEGSGEADAELDRQAQAALK